MMTSTTITCPQCRAEIKEIMPLDAWLISYECRACGATLRPKAGTCCVFYDMQSIKTTVPRGTVTE
ncbi:MAG: GDCCVxC domain-containing (seleno)protein [Nitrospirota bacterium]